MRIFILTLITCLIPFIAFAQVDEKAACDAGDAIGCNRWAFQLEHGDGVEPDLAAAQIYYGKGCDLGLAVSCTNFGLFLEDGRGGETDVMRAFGYLERGCTGGDPKGCDWVAKFHRDVDALKDPVRAAEYAAKGCALDYTASCIWEGIAYEDGAGVPLDLVQSADRYEKACDLGNGSGCYNAGRLFRSKAGAVFGPDRMARSYAISARGCDMEHVLSCDAVAYALSSGRGVAKDLIRARSVVEWTCSKDSGIGCSNLSRFLKNGDGGPVDLPRSVELARKACDLGYERAC